MHKVVTHTDSSSKPALRSQRDRDHVIKLIQMISSRMDTIARNELFKQHAAAHGMQQSLELIEEAQRRDQAHIDWLKEQIRSSIK